MRTSCSCRHSPASMIGSASSTDCTTTSTQHIRPTCICCRGPWPSTLCLIICVIDHSTLQRLCDHWKLTCSLLTSTLSALEVLPRNALDKSTYLLTYLLNIFTISSFHLILFIQSFILALWQVVSTIDLFFSPTGLIPQTFDHVSFCSTARFVCMAC